MSVIALCMVLLAAAARGRCAAPALDPAVAGRYQLLGEAPIAAAHAMQLPCGHDTFLLMGECAHSVPWTAGEPVVRARAVAAGVTRRDVARHSRARARTLPWQSRRAALTRQPTCPHRPLPPSLPRVWSHRRRGQAHAAPPAQQPGRLEGPVGAQGTHGLASLLGRAAPLARTSANGGLTYV